MAKKETRTARMPEPRWKPSEVKIVEAKAAKLGLPVSSYIRQAALCYKP